MNRGVDFLEGYPALAGVVEHLDNYLQNRHPNFFCESPLHPVLPVKRSKVVHDNLWGTVRFSWRELALIDSPIMQRLRDIHQTGLAFHVYPSAHHSRFEHSLGSMNVASRVFDALLHKQRGEIHDIAKVIDPEADNQEEIIRRLKQELRLAALLHDTGHSLYSHTSERVYEALEPLKKASSELTRFVGKEKGAGEVLSFCLVLTPSLCRFLNRAESDLIGDEVFDDYTGHIDLQNVALMIVGRSFHPFVQFLGDIVSSGFDADKLDYLRRDALAAGLPLNYDIDRYLYDVRIKKEVLADGDGELRKLYERSSRVSAKRLANSPQSRFPYYETYRLRLSKRAMNVIEQIVISKMMLFSYIYHHGKVRSAEGLLERLLLRKLYDWRQNGESASDIVSRFMDMTDASLRNIVASEEQDPVSGDCAYRLVNRLLPREVYSIGSSSATHAAGDVVKEFFRNIHQRKTRKELIRSLEKEIGSQLTKIQSDIGHDPDDALAKTGVWVDAPKLPKFEDVDTMVGNPTNVHADVPIDQVFPIHKWTEAYEHYRHQVRIFAYSEYVDQAREAAKAAMKVVIGISGDDFYRGIRKYRS